MGLVDGRTYSEYPKRGKVRVELRTPPHKSSVYINDREVSFSRLVIDCDIPGRRTTLQMERIIHGEDQIATIEGTLVYLEDPEEGNDPPEA